MNDLLKDCRQYNFETARRIALEHARGDSLAKLHENHPDEIPDPATIRRWRREFPAFDIVMTEAEHARADLLADETVDIADSKDCTAAQANNRIKARQWLASRLHRNKYGRTPAPELKPTNGDSGNGDRLLSQYSDDDLQRIISAGLKATSIEGQATSDRTPGTPPRQKAAGLEQNAGSDTPEPITSEPGSSVTTNENMPDF